MSGPRSRTPSPTGQDTRRSSPDVVNEPSHSQVEQDLGFFVQDGGRSPGAIPINPMANRFFGRQRRNSGESTNSDAAFIDHRTQQHSMSTSAQRRPTVTSRPTPGRQHGMGRGLSNGTGQEQESSAMQQLRGLQISPPATPRIQPAYSQRAEDEDESAVLDHRPASIHSNGSRGSRHGERRGSGHADMPVFTPSISRRPSDAERALEDVCFPHLDMRDSNLDDAARTAGPPLSHGIRGGLPGLLPNFPFPFDFSALEELASTERELASPSIRPNDPLISFSPPRFPADKIGPRMNGDLEGKPTRRMRRLSESAGNARSGRYQRKLALFEGFGSQAALASATPETQRRADQRTPLLGRTRSGRAVHADIGTGGRPGLRRGNSTTGAGAADSEKERPYRFSFYSNGLPSTIHARSLGEIPAENQSFEELFSGRKKSSDAGLDSAFSAVDGHEGTPGANTNGYMQPPKSGGGVSSRATTLVRGDEETEDNTWWLDVLCPTDAEMKAFSKCFGIHPLTTEDIQMEETREKIELFRNYYLVCFRSFDQDPYSPTYLEPLNMYVIVFREGTLSFHYRATPHPQNVRRRIKQLKDYISVSSDWISYALIDDITDAFGPLIQNIEYEVDSIDELVLILKETEQSDMLRRIGTCRKKVMGLLRLMGNKADVVKGLAKRCNENWSVAPKSDIGLYLSDIQDHLLTMTANLNHYEKILSRSHSNYLAQISIEMTEANNQINDVLSRLTALGTVLVPLNLVTGLWGMNVTVPGQGVEGLAWFFSIVAVLTTFALVGGWIAYRLMLRR